MEALLGLLQSGGISTAPEILGTIESWGYFILLFLVVIEGPFATLLGGAAAASGVMQPLPVFLTASAGNVIGDTLWYVLGYGGASEGCLRLLRRLGVRRNQVQRLKKQMNKRPVRLLVTAKLSGLIVPAMLAAGLSRVSWRRWLLIVVTAEILWAGSLVAFGLYMTDSIGEVNQALRLLTLFAICVLGAFLARMYFYSAQCQEEELRSEGEKETAVTADISR